jgi:hypothetical protein
MSRDTGRAAAGRAGSFNSGYPNFKKKDEEEQKHKSVTRGHVQSARLATRVLTGMRVVMWETLDAK